MRRNGGFTLVELIVSMAIFIGIMLIASYAFERVLATSGQQIKSAESNIEGVTGLEMMRYDVEHAGYGLPWTFQNYTGAITFKNLGSTANQEVDVASEFPAKGVDSNSFNAARATNIHALTAGTATKEVTGAAATNAGGGPDYLVIRSTVSALNDTARRWAYVSYSSGGNSHLRTWNNSDDFKANDRIITIRSSFTSAGKEDKILLMDSSDNFEVKLPSDLALPVGTAFKPADESQMVVAYGIRSNSASSSVTLRMPYNRSDYYVARPTTNMPQECNPGTGILYKAEANHSSGGFSAPYPLLDCVGDMQVEFEYDPDDDGNISYLPPASLAALSAEDIRNHLKTVRIHILAHEGKKDRSFSYPGNTVQVGDSARPASSGRTLSSAEMASLFGSDWRNYRWKLYTIVTRPKNLVN